MRFYVSIGDRRYLESLPERSSSSWLSKIIIQQKTRVLCYFPTSNFTWLWIFSFVSRPSFSLLSESQDFIFTVWMNEINDSVAKSGGTTSAFKAPPWLLNYSNLMPTNFPSLINIMQIISLCERKLNVRKIIKKKKKRTARGNPTTLLRLVSVDNRSEAVCALKFIIWLSSTRLFDRLFPLLPLSLSRAWRD